MGFLIIDLSCALSSSVGSNLAHQALSQWLTHSYTHLQLKHIRFCVFNLPSFYCCSSFCFALLSSLSLCFLVLSLVELTTMTFHLDKIKPNEVAVKINHFLYREGNKAMPGRIKHHTFSPFPFTSFHIFSFLENNRFD